MASYPGTLFPWTNKVDLVNIVDANDVNAMAADLIAVETNLGLNIQNEPLPPAGNGTGTPIVYTNVGARISDAMNNNKMPVCSVSLTTTTIANNTIGSKVQYNQVYDPYKMFNGSDITIPASGWWILSGQQTWSWWDKGFSHHRLVISKSDGDHDIDDFLINWEFPGNTVTSGVPGRWQQFGKRPLTSKVFWQGLAHAGDRFSCISENGTTNASQTVTNLTMKACMTVSFEGNTNFVSG